LHYGAHGVTILVRFWWPWRSGVIESSGSQLDIVELREYRILPRNRSAFWRNYKSVGLPVQTRYLAHPLGFYFVEIGSPNTFVHMWAYRSLAEREASRAALHDDPAWVKYVTGAHAFIEDINVRLLRNLGLPVVPGAGEDADGAMGTLTDRPSSEHRS